MNLYTFLNHLRFSRNRVVCLALFLINSGTAGISIPLTKVIVNCVFVLREWDLLSYALFFFLLSLMEQCNFLFKTDLVHGFIWIFCTWIQIVHRLYVVLSGSWCIYNVFMCKFRSSLSSWLGTWIFTLPISSRANNLKWKKSWFRVL